MLRAIKSLALITMVALLAFAWMDLASADQGSDKSRKVVVFICDRLELADLSQDVTPELYDLARTNGLGLVGLQKAFAYKNVPSAFYATVNAGATANGIESSTLTYWDAVKLKNEEQQSLFEIRANQLAESNAYRHTIAEVGLLGEALHIHGLKTAGLGVSANAEQNAEFLNMLMDKKGKIDHLALEISGKSANFESEMQKFESDFHLLHSKSSLTAVHFGDIPPKAPRNRYARAAAISKAEAILESILKVIDNDDLLIVLMPFNKATAKYGISIDTITKGEMLSPIIIKGNSYNGMLMSASTRREGVVIASDIMPTVLSYLQVSAKRGYSGMKIFSKETDKDEMQLLRALSDKAIRHDVFMLPVLVFFGILGIIALLFSLLVVIFGWSSKLGYIARVLLTAVFIFPTALSLLAPFNIRELWQYFLALFAILLLSVPLALVFGKSLWPMVFILGINPVLTIFDFFIGQAMINDSLLGNSLLTGGRYYGLGNQYLGFVFIYSLLSFIFIGTISPWNAQKLSFKAFALLSLATMIAVFGMPRLGANFGATITLAASLPFISFRFFSDRKINYKHFLLFTLLALFMISAVVVYDALQKSQVQSHIGRSFSLAINSGMEIMANLVRKKLAQNLEEIVMVLFTWGGAVVIAILAGLTYSFSQRLMPLLHNQRYFLRFLPGILFTATIALLFNDTGFEPFAIIMLYALAAFLYLSIFLQSSMGISSIE